MADSIVPVGLRRPRFADRAPAPDPTTTVVAKPPDTSLDAIRGSAFPPPDTPGNRPVSDPGKAPEELKQPIEDQYLGTNETLPDNHHAPPPPHEPRPFRFPTAIPPANPRLRCRTRIAVTRDRPPSGEFLHGLHAPTPRELGVAIPSGCALKCRATLALSSAKRLNRPVTDRRASIPRSRTWPGSGACRRHSPGPRRHSRLGVAGARRPGGAPAVPGSPESR